MNALPMKSPDAIDHGYDFGEAKKSNIPKTSGGRVPVIFNHQNFEHRYVDEYAGEELPPPPVKRSN